ncbi:MAG: sigma-54 dependent transcriptional regulator, partial [Desulfopila sp.]|nr:sigma-54 dependent transcriptional regulator [Desulfopila sp.]
MTFTPTILFIDQDRVNTADVIDSLKTKSRGIFIHAESKAKLSSVLNQTQPDIVFLDLHFFDTHSSLHLLRKFREKSLVTIAALPEENSELISQVLAANPFFHITKPYDLQEVHYVLKRAVQKAIHNRETTQNHPVQQHFCGLIGQSPQMLSLFDLIGRVAEDDYATVLIRGESGTGKELVAKAIHAKSSRKSKNFVPVNCAAIPDDLLESELFGHTKGAFTGATHSKQGRIQYADGGTLFLDEIGDMKPTLQAKLLRVLQEKEFEPVGGLQSTPVDTRILAATHCDLEQLVSEGKFREDLYYRLSVIPLSIPPLKSRKEDIPLLISSFIHSYTVERGRERFEFTDKAMRSLLQYNWRGNVRELENLVQHMSILFSGKKIDVADLPEKYLLAENRTEDDDCCLAPNMSDSVCSTSPASFFLEHDNPETVDAEVDFKEMIHQYEV